MVDKQVTLELVGLDGNAFFLIGSFTRQARREKWTPEEIDEVIQECMSNDYDHLLSTLVKYCKSPEREEDEEDFD
jgi:hypothetical protein